MASGDGRIPEEHLQEFLRGCAHGLQIITGHVDNFLRPAEPGLPEEEGEYEEGEYNIGHFFPPLREDHHQLEDTDEEADDEDTDDEDNWSDWSEDSGYGSISEEDEDTEEEEQEDVDEDVEDYSDDDGSLPYSPLIQHFPPPKCWQQCRPVCPSFPTGAPFWLCPFGGPQQELPALQVRQPEYGLPSASQRSEESAPSTSGLGSSTKRSREESDTLQVSTKRLKWNCEDSHDEPPSSTSGLGPYIYRSREDSYGESTPSTSGLGPSTYRRREDSSRESAPSTSGLGPSPFRRYWMGPFDYMRGTEDSDSD